MEVGLPGLSRPPRRCRAEAVGCPVGLVGGRAPARRRGWGCSPNVQPDGETQVFLNYLCRREGNAGGCARPPRASPAAQPALPPGPPPALQPEASPSRPPFSVTFFCEIRPWIFKESAKLLKYGKGGNIIRLVLIRGSVGPPRVGGSAIAFILMGALAAPP